jgi:hypothetical protein
VKLSARWLRHILVALLYATGVGFGIGFATASTLAGLATGLLTWPVFTLAIRERDD